MARILVVDDDLDLVETCRIVLEKAGHSVLTAHNPTEGRATLEKEKPDLLVLDVMMDQPDDGIQMAQQLRREGIHTPILMLTSLAKVTGMGYGQDSDMVPVDIFQEKPVAPSRLLELVDQLLKRKG